MHPLIIKRDDSKVPFTTERIIYAISKAIHEVYGDKKTPETIETAKAIAQDIANELENQPAPVKISEIQQKVEIKLMALDPQVARAYIEFRHNKDIARESKGELVRDIKGLIEQSDINILHENANKASETIPAQRDLLSGIVSKHFAKNHILPRDIVIAHEKGELHYHDLDYSPLFPSFNCMLVDLKGMLEGGFKMVNAEIEPPRSIKTAAEVTAQIISQVAAHIYGGTSINRIDEVLSPYVVMSYKKHLITAEKWGVKEPEKYATELTEKECYDCFQAVEYMINGSQTNGQSPFVTFGFGLGTTWEARLIQTSILKIRIAGLGKKRKTAVFPKLVFAIKDGINHKPTDPNYDIKRLALECSSKRMYPDILNYERIVEATGSFKAPMGCRSFLSPYEENGKEIHDGRNNLGVVSLNLPRIALESRGDEGKFYEILDQRLALARRALETRIDRFRGVKAKVAPILYLEGAVGVRLQPEDDVIDLFKNGRASISLGYIGLHETIVALFGAEVHVFDSQYLRGKQTEILQYLRNAVDDWKEDSGWGYSLYATPSENLCNRFCKLDSKQFGIIKGVTDKGYYTNSFHLDVQKKTNPYDKVDFEMNEPDISSGGAIIYTEFPSMINNLDGLEDMWDYTYDKAPYYATNTPIDECYECNFKGEFTCTSKGFECPKCGNNDSPKMSVIRRVCGYLGSAESRPFNSGKQIEIKMRVKHLTQYDEEKDQ